MPPYEKPAQLYDVLWYVYEYVTLGTKNMSLENLDSTYLNEVHLRRRKDGLCKLESIGGVEKVTKLTH